MAKGYRGGQEQGLRTGYAQNGVQEARRLNQQAFEGANQAEYEFGALGEQQQQDGLRAGFAPTGTQEARQLNRNAMENAARKAGR